MAEVAKAASAILFARHVLNLEGESPLRAVVTGTARLGQGVRREAESEGSRCQNSDSTNRNRIQGRTHRVTRQWTRTPNRHAEVRTVNPARPERRVQDLTWEIFRPVGTNPTTASATAWEGAREVSRGRSRFGLAARSIETLARKGRNGRGSQGRIAEVKG